MPPDSGGRPKGQERIPSSDMVPVTAGTLWDVPQPPPSSAPSETHMFHVPWPLFPPLTHMPLYFNLSGDFHGRDSFPSYSNHQNQTHNSNPDPELNPILISTLSLCLVFLSTLSLSGSWGGYAKGEGRPPLPDELSVHCRPYMSICGFGTLNTFYVLYVLGLEPRTLLSSQQTELPPP